MLRTFEEKGDLVFELGPIRLPANAMHDDISQPPPLTVLAGVEGWAHGYTIELIDSGLFSPGNVYDGKPIVERLLSEGEPYFVLADFADYARAQAEVDAWYLKPDEWSRKAVLNTVNMGTFSSDRSIREYAERIWHIKPVL